jgi:hypothetical protein
MTPREISGCVSFASDNTFFIRVPPLEKEDLNEFKGGTLMKKVFQKSPIFSVVVIGTNIDSKM